MNNKFILDSKDFIQYKNRHCVFYFGFKYNNQIYGVWQDKQNGFLFVSYDYDPESGYILSTNINDHDENTILLKKLKDTTVWSDFIDAYKYCMMRFETINIKNEVYNLIKTMLN